ncbi:hypothetical protein DRN87_02650 [Candidatus Geothermarchaeota archaeon]|nr:MAG: hypothetical protein DRN87_02650 [Candidatus Geothermarchaeota archaeon]HEW93614.1 hypothetical protein [Thermoprotei archaeon]
MDNTVAYLLMEVVIAVVCISLVLVFSNLLSSSILGLFHRHLNNGTIYSDGLIRIIRELVLNV